jgi:hypothetical protein
MSKRKISLLLLLSSGYLVALGCSLFGPLRINFSDLLAGFGLGS